MRKGYKTVHILKEEWTYKVGRSYTSVYSPTEKKFLVQNNKLAYEYEAIRPSAVKEYIILNIREPKP